MTDPFQQRGRIVTGSGNVNIVRRGGRMRLLGDLYHFFLTASWPAVLGIFGGGYLVSNAIFALAYLIEDHAIRGARPGSFADAFFFSVQTMSTIGYGTQTPRTVYANVLVTVEAFVGVLGLAMITGLIFAKFSRPTSRVLFSRVAVVARRNGVPCLMFRMANQRGNGIVEARVHVVLALTEATAEGEVIRGLHDLDLIRGQNVLFALSWTAIHPIDENSPIYGATQQTLAAGEAEVIVSLTGLDETFSQTVHARHSYVPDEILWNARFVDILSRDDEGRRVVDYSLFHDVVPDGS